MQMVVEGGVDFVCFDTLAERTLAAAQQRRAADASAGYDVMLRDRFGPLLRPSLDQGIRLAGNMGAANPAAATLVLAEEAIIAGVDGLTIGTVTGDDILDHVLSGDLPIALWDRELKLSDLSNRLVSANAYLGFKPILEALDKGADVVVTGRGADVAPYMAATFHHFRWDLEDLQKLASAAMIGHLLECGRCVTGTCFEEPAFGRHTPDPADASLPIGEVSPDGDAVITKVPGTGGHVTRATCAEQLIHETNDPSRYLTPDVTLDLTRVRLEDQGGDRVLVSGARGTAPPDTYKVLLGVDEGWIAEGEVSFAGLGAVRKARMAARIVRERLDKARFAALDYREDIIGLDSVLGPASPVARDEPFDVRLRIACRVRTREETEVFSLECQDLWWAPGVGGGGVRTHARRVLGMRAASVPQQEVPVSVAISRERTAAASEEMRDAAG
jgi:acyclic terpene utilization AtuA family protein